MVHNNSQVDTIFFETNLYNESCISIRKGSIQKKEKNNKRNPYKKYFTLKLVSI